jgi:hypothetical protein
VELFSWVGGGTDVYRVVKLEVTDPERPHEDFSKILGIAKRYFDGPKYLKDYHH